MNKAEKEASRNGKEVRFTGSNSLEPEKKEV